MFKQFVPSFSCLPCVGSLIAAMPQDPKWEHEGIGRMDLVALVKASINQS